MAGKRHFAPLRQRTSDVSTMDTTIFDTDATAIPHSSPARAIRSFDGVPLIAGCVAFCVVVFLPAILNDGVTLWQIRTGEWILDHHAIPSVDPFSFTAGNKRWFSHEWLAEVLLALAFRAGGIAGVMALAALACGLATGFLLRTLRRFLPGNYAIVGTFLALADAAPSLLARPHLLAWPALVIWCGGLVTARAGRRAPSFTLLPVILVWVNMHGSFMVGLLLPCALLVEALFDPGADRRRVLLGWGGFIASAWAIALLNPDGLDGLLFPFRMVQMKALQWIGEWRPIDFSHLHPVELTLSGALAAGLLGKFTLPPVRLLLLLGLVHMSLAHVRNTQLLGIVGVLIVAETVGTRLARGAAMPMPRRWHFLAVGVFGLAALALVARMMIPIGSHEPGRAFASALQTVPEPLRSQPVLNDYSVGGDLIFHGIRPFIDSRADLYGDEFVERYRQITSKRQELLRALAAYDIAWAILPSTSTMKELFDGLPGWRPLPEKEGIEVYVRD
jgi:hypothetical protein